MLTGAIQSGGQTPFGETLSYSDESLYPTAQVRKAQNAAVAASYLNGLIRNTPIATESPNAPLMRPQDSIIGSLAARQRAQQMLATAVRNHLPPGGRLYHSSEAGAHDWEETKNKLPIGVRKAVHSVEGYVVPRLPSTNKSRVTQEFHLLNNDIQKLTGLESRWKGKVNIKTGTNRMADPTLVARKEWECSISIHTATLTKPKASRYATQVHEMFHAVSAGLDKDNFQEFQGFEEGVVEQCTRLFGQGIFARTGLKEKFPARTNYDEYVKPLEVCREAIGISPKEFYLSLLKTPLADREATIKNWIKERYNEGIPKNDERYNNNVPRDVEAKVKEAFEELKKDHTLRIRNE